MVLYLPVGRCGLPHSPPKDILTDPITGTPHPFPHLLVTRHTRYPFSRSISAHSFMGNTNVQLAGKSYNALEKGNKPQVKTNILWTKLHLRILSVMLDDFHFRTTFVDLPIFINIISRIEFCPKTPIHQTPTRGNAIPFLLSSLQAKLRDMFEALPLSPAKQLYVRIR